MFTSLISVSIANNDCEYIEKLPKNLMTPAEAELVDWLLDYKNRHGQLPTIDRFKQTKYGIYYQEVLLKTPLSDLFDETIKSFCFNSVEYAFNKIRDDYNTGRSISIAPFTELSAKIAASSPVSSRSIGEFDLTDLIPEKGDYIPFGLSTFDIASGGISKGETAFFFAPSGIGKTTYLCFLAVRAARRGYKVLLTSKEMSDVRITQRIMAILGNFDTFWFTKSSHDTSFVSKIKAKNAFIQKQIASYEALGGDIVIPKAQVFTPKDILGKIIEEKQKKDRTFDLVLIDGMNHMRSNDAAVGTTAADDWRVMRSVSMQLLEVAQNEEYPTRVIATSQLKPGTPTSKCGGFDFSDVGYSRAVVEDASVVGVLSKSDGAIASASSKVKYLWAHMLKNRNGEDAATVPVTQLKFDFATMNMFGGDTKFNTELSATPLGAELAVAP